MSLTATVYVDISREPGHEADDRRSLCHLDDLPDGARVRVYVGARWYISPDAAAILHCASLRLEVELVAESGREVRRWLEAIRAGRLEAA